MAKNKLTAKQSAFCPHFVKLHNGRHAVHAVSPKLSDASADSLAWKWLSLDKVQEEIARLRKEVEKSTLMDAVECERLLDLCLRANPKSYVGETGIPKDVSKLTDDQAFAVGTIETWHKETVDGGGILGGTTLKLLSKEALFKLKMKRLGLLKDNIIHEAGKSFEDMMRELNGLPPAGKEGKG